MATVTGLTAERMLAIEAESIIDGDVVGNNLILKRHDGVTIDAGPVKGPKGDTGSSGISVAQSSLAVLEVGIANQIRAGRQLTVADFTRMGLQSPVGLFNLSDLGNLGTGGPLVNKGSVPFVPGINGLAATAALFAGSSAQALYITDAAGGPFNPKTLSLGAWFRTAKRGTSIQGIAGKAGAGAASSVGSYLLYINSTNNLQAWVTNGSQDANAVSQLDVCDDRWHFAVMTWDAGVLRVYIDGALEVEVANGALPQPQQINEPFSIGASDADAASTSNQFWGRIDEVFLTSEVLSEDQVRLLYCTKIAHGASSTPLNALINVHRRRKGVPFVVGDFTAQPRRLYNFAAGSLTDAGLDNVALTVSGSPLLVAGADGAKDNAFYLDGASWLSGSGAGLPSGLADRTVGCWFKTLDSDGGGIICLAGTGTGNDVRYLYIQPGGELRSYDGTNTTVSNRLVHDGQWHFGVVVYQNTSPDACRLKLYLDGRLQAISTVLASTNALGIDIGRQATGGTSADRFAGAIDGVFICDYAMTPEQIRTLYAKGSQDVGLSPRMASDHVEAFDSTSIYAIFDSLESQQLVDLAVAA